MSPPKKLKEVHSAAELPGGPLAGGQRQGASSPAKTSAPYRKDSLTGLYAAMFSRKKKVLAPPPPPSPKQAKGKNAMKRFGKVDIPQRSFHRSCSKRD